jgi:hypothetical protein
LNQLILLACLSLSSQAWGDINESGNLVVGGTATIQGGAFSVGGSTLSVAAGTTSIGGLLQLSSTGIKFGDSTTQTTAATAFSYNIKYASGTADVNLSASFASIAGSTLTMTTQRNGSRFLIHLTSLGRAAVSGGTDMQGRVLMNGQPIGARSACVGQTTATNDTLNCDFALWTTTNTASQTYSFVLQMKTSGGNAILCADGSGCDGAGLTGRGPWQFVVEEK